MLNPAFTAEIDRAYGSRYVLPPELSDTIVSANSDLGVGPELRLQEAFGDELWSRLRQLRLEGLDWTGADVLDACCGSGFLSYHLLGRARPRRLTMLDVSPAELQLGEGLVRSRMWEGGEIRALCADLADADLVSEAFDVVIGNSFLHHFPDVPRALRAIFRLLRPGGLLIGLHEPTPAAMAWESGDGRQVAAFFFLRRWYLALLRHPGPGPVREGATDVWLFRPDDTGRLLADAGFDDVRVAPRYLMRPFVVAAFNLHLTRERPRLTERGERLLRRSVLLDARLTRVLPRRVFGGLSFAARRPV